MGQQIADFPDAEDRELLQLLFQGQGPGLARAEALVRTFDRGVSFFWVIVF
ncbi:MAG: hypothetical protein IH892_14340 [Planctomycetes bacterium]|nr:hypothetical protein [Planctomycetota bacterium]